MGNPVLDRLQSQAEKSPGLSADPQVTNRSLYPQQSGYLPQNHNYPAGQPNLNPVSQLGDNYSSQGMPSHGTGYPVAGAYGIPGVPVGQTREGGSDQNVQRAMTLDDVLIKTALSFVVLLFGATVSWVLCGTNPELAIGLASISGIVAFVLVLVSSFKSKPSAPLTLAYAGFEGLAIGAISWVFDSLFQGIVIEALLATLCLFLTCLVLFKTGMVRVNGKFMRMMMIGLIGLVAYRLIAALLTVTGLVETHPSDLYIAGLPLGLIVGLIAIIIGSMSLVMDFDTARECVRLGMPAPYAWSCALGFMVTIVWIYIEVLRILAYLRELASD